MKRLHNTGRHVADMGDDAFEVSISEDMGRPHFVRVIRTDERLHLFVADVFNLFGFDN